MLNVLSLALFVVPVIAHEAYAKSCAKPVPVLPGRPSLSIIPYYYAVYNILFTGTVEG
jgi:hypothetical protein